MGRLDDQAKHRIVVLRKAGLSFRKIKKVLELDNIKVTPQAIYLFLKRKNIEPEKSSAAPQNLPTKVQPWEQAQLWSLLQDTGGQKQDGAPQVANNAQKTTAGLKPQDVKEQDIKIVSVTSLSQGNPSLEPPTNSPRTVPQAVPQGQRVQDTRSGTVRPTQHPALSVTRPNPPYFTSHNHINGRARTPLPAPRNPALLVTKKLVDKAIILQKKVIFQNGGQPSTPGGQYPLPTTSHQHRLIPVTKASTQQLKDAGTQTAPSFPSARPDASVEQLDSIRGELHRLTQVMQTLIERQNRWEQEQMRQRQCNHQEVLSQIQQLGAKLTQTYVPFNNGQETETQLPDFGHFKIELL